MRINKNFKIYNTPSFKREPSKNVMLKNGLSEAQEYPIIIQEAKDFLGIDNLALILHQSSFPIKDNDLFIGSHINSKALELNKFLKFHGFDSIQIGPPGLTKLSPYTSSINSKNYVYTDIEKFYTPEYATLLQEKDIKTVLDSVDYNRKYEKNSDSTNFTTAFYVVDKLFEKAYKNFQVKIKKNNSRAIKLNNEFESFKNKENYWLEKDAVYQYFKQKRNLDESFFEWPDLFQNLFKYVENPNEPRHKEACEYLERIKSNSDNFLDLYKFKQFIIEKQEKEFKKQNGKLPYITDAIIGFHMMDYFANPDAFLPNYRIGTPYGGEGRPLNGSPWGSNQTWDIPVLDPQKLFIKDKNGNITGLGVAGKLMRQKFEKLLDTYENIRIDHAIGLIDPWIYNKNNVEIKMGRYPEESSEVPEHIIYKNAHGSNISAMHKENIFNNTGWGHDLTKLINDEIADMPDIDPDGDYAKILDEILIPLFKEKGVTPKDMAWETLGCDTQKFRNVFNKVRNGKLLPEITSAYEWQVEKRQANPRHKNNWVILGCHDHPPFAQVCDNNFYREKNCKNGIYEEDYITGSLYPELNNKQRQEIKNNLWWDKRLRVKLKFTELLRFGEKVQLTFMDFFGLDKTYNKAGTQDPQNWKLRLKKSYKEDYYKALAWQPGDKGVDKVALNIPELLKRAVISKTVMDGQDLSTTTDLVKKLDYYENVLKEPF